MTASQSDLLMDFQPAWTSTESIIILFKLVLNCDSSQYQLYLFALHYMSLSDTLFSLKS